MVFQYITNIKYNEIIDNKEDYDIILVSKDGFKIYCQKKVLKNIEFFRLFFDSNFSDSKNEEVYFDRNYIVLKEFIKYIYLKKFSIDYLDDLVDLYVLFEKYMIDDYSKIIYESLNVNKMLLANREKLGTKIKRDIYRCHFLNDLEKEHPYIFPSSPEEKKRLLDSEETLGKIMVLAQRSKPYRISCLFCFLMSRNTEKKIDNKN